MTSCVMRVNFTTSSVMRVNFMTSSVIRVNFMTRNLMKVKFMTTNVIRVNFLLIAFFFFFSTNHELRKSDAIFFIHWQLFIQDNLSCLTMHIDICFHKLFYPPTIACRVPTLTAGLTDALVMKAQSSGKKMDQYHVFYL